MLDALHFPRLSLRGVRILLQQGTDALAAMDWKDRRDLAGSQVSFPATGGRRITDADLMRIRARVLSIASDAGYPLVTRDARSSFDKQLARALVEDDLVSGPDALRDDVWAFLSTVLLADLVRWRWDATVDRYRGGVRNALQRLWLRGVSFRRDAETDRWELVEGINEDASMSLLERPGLTGSRHVTRAIGEVWLELSRIRPALPLEAMTRRVSITLRITNQIMPLHVLDETALEAEIREHFRLAQVTG